MPGADKLQDIVRPGILRPPLISGGQICWLSKSRFLKEERAEVRTAKVSWDEHIDQNS